MADPNPLVSDRDVRFQLYELGGAADLCDLEAFADHGPETFELFLRSARTLARGLLYPAYRAMDADPPRFEDGRIRVHPAMRAIWPRLAELGVLAASRPYAVGGQQLPRSVAIVAEAYLMAANLGAYGYAGLTAGAAHLIEAFGDEWLRERFMRRMYAGEWTGTMALTEPQAGSSLGDITTRATPAGDGTYRVQGHKIFISAGDHDLTDNVVHLALARVDGGPPGVQGISLLAVPRRRFGADGLVDNDVHTAGMIHKIGWRGLPSLVINFGEQGDCHGWLVGEVHRGLAHMFQMMNEARIMVGVNGVATASVAYHEALRYAQERRQGRLPGARDPRAAQVPIVAHADVRRMLLRQKAIVEGGLALLVQVARYADLAEHAREPEERRRAQRLLDLLTPVAKSFPAERGFESNALALQIHGGYGYSSEYLPEAWLRDQKLNSIHEGTTGIHGLDLLGRRALADGALPALAAEFDRAGADARAAGVPDAWVDEFAAAGRLVAALTAELAARGARGEPEFMLRHSSDYLDLFSTLVIAWQWLRQATVAARARPTSDADRDFYAGKRCAAQYWLATELPRVPHLARLCRDGEDSYAQMRPEWF
jgi:alkylation response protein AidB-like acyl-CoA dehydrogenase